MKILIVKMKVKIKNVKNVKLDILLIQISNVKNAKIIIVKIVMIRNAMNVK